MIKLILTDLDGTFLNSKGDYNKEDFSNILSELTKKNIAFGAVTGKQTERVEELFGDLADKIWILGDSASRIKHAGKFEFESLIPNSKGLDIISKLEAFKPTKLLLLVRRKQQLLLTDVNCSMASLFVDLMRRLMWLKISQK